MNKYLRLILIGVFIFLTLLGIFFAWVKLIGPFFQERNRITDMENTQQERRNYIPDASIIAKLVEEFQKQDNELSQTGEYIIPSIETPLVQKSPYGSFASNQLLITLSSNAECSSVIRALFIVGASSTYRMMSVYGGSGELLSRERTVMIKKCNIDWLIVTPSDTSLEKFIAIEKFLETKTELFNSIGRNKIMK